jgi:hypothetical protein
MSKRTFGAILWLVSTSGFAQTLEPGIYQSRFVAEVTGIRTRLTTIVQDSETLQTVYDTVVRHPLTGESVAVELRWQLKYRAGPEIQSGIYALDSTVDWVTETPMSQHVVAQYNDEGRCGYTDWEIAVAKDITDRHCEEYDAVFQLPRNVDHNIFRQDGHTLWLGRYENADAGSLPELRPSHLDTRFPMLRVQNFWLKNRMRSYN